MDGAIWRRPLPHHYPILPINTGCVGGKKEDNAYNYDIIEHHNHIYRATINMEWSCIQYLYIYYCWGGHVKWIVYNKRLKGTQHMRWSCKSGFSSCVRMIVRKKVPFFRVSVTKILIRFIGWWNDNILRGTTSRMSHPIQYSLSFESP